MEFYLFILIILFATALADLYVGVANDAVNFLNSAIGSKAGSRLAIMVTASLGVFVGTTFSTGMLEVARSGIFNPAMFTFHEVMIVFLAVMLTDIILLDLYNTFSLPTSTTVSLVFELIGGAVAMSWIKVMAAGGDFGGVFAFLNTARVVTIVSSIGLSILLAFVVGVSVQFVTRLVFTFDYEKRFRWVGAAYTASGLTAIVYFILVKGAKGSAILTPSQMEWIAANMAMLLVGVFIALTVLFQALILATRVNVLKIVVFAGTFALALAFAANDLVNFIGAPMGALHAYQLGVAAPGDVASMTMEGLSAPVRVNPWFLIVAGGIMVGTLWVSKKARSVTQTSLSLGRQEEGVERFSSSALARSIVRMSLSLHDVYRAVTPVTLQRVVSERLDPARAPKYTGEDGVPPAFDLLRASVNLMVASSLISIGTAFKLPLSTTFVTFMVAMSTSLADSAWGRESAVYRVNGVITVIGGWFVTAMLAFTVCFGFTFAIYHGGLPAIIGLVVVGFYFYFHTNRIHAVREAEFAQQEKLYAGIGATDMLAHSRDVAQYLKDAEKAIEGSYEGLIRSNRRMLSDAAFRSRKLNDQGDKLIGAILLLLRTATDEDRGITPRYGRKIAALQIVAANLSSLTSGTQGYVENNHTPPDDEQALELREVHATVGRVLHTVAGALEQSRFDEVAEADAAVQRLKELIREFDRRQMQRIRLGRSKTRQSLVFIGTLNKAERIADQAVILLRLYGESMEELRAGIDMPTA
ncbi:MAG: inorganic phosphate transporter [Gemmatimonadetes bacterium]|nr:inorganic phosphate transporter [Gemmatimonadota bacterium]